MQEASATHRRSAGLLMFRRGASGHEVFLVHPGGPFFARKDTGVWTIPKGEMAVGEQALDVARREFDEETGQTVEACRRARGGGVGTMADADMIPLGSITQRGGKVVEAWAFEGDWPAGAVLRSNTFVMEWPPSSGDRREFPEVDRGEFLPLPLAREKINPAQAELIDRLLDRLGAS